MKASNNSRNMLMLKGSLSKLEQKENVAVARLAMKRWL
jgi:hypothetical protein